MILALGFPSTGVGLYCVHILQCSSIISPGRAFRMIRSPRSPLPLPLSNWMDHFLVVKTKTVVELKQGVEAAFSHLPKKGLGMVSWPHVWGHFFLSYNGQKLLADHDHISDFQIQDGDKLRFIRHTSVSYYMVKEGLDEEDTDLDKPTISGDCEERHSNGEKDDVHHERDLENQRDNYDHDEDKDVMSSCQGKLAHLLRGWLSYRKLGRPETGLEEKHSSPGSFFGIFGCSRNVARHNNNKYDSLRETWKAK